MRRAGLALLLACAASAFAQSKQPALVCGCPSGLTKGDSSVTLAYQRANVTRHYNMYGDEVDRGSIRADAALLAFDYAFTDQRRAAMALTERRPAEHLDQETRCRHHRTCFRRDARRRLRISNPGEGHSGSDDADHLTPHLCIELRIGGRLRERPKPRYG